MNSNHQLVDVQDLAAGPHPCTVPYGAGVWRGVLHVAGGQVPWEYVDVVAGVG